MKVALGLGSSLGDRHGHLSLALRRLHTTEGISVLRVSRAYRTPPMRGGTARGWFLNAVALLDVDVPAHVLLALCRRLEDEAGRRRARYWGDRPLDLDILLVEDAVIDSPDLTVPHPGIADRPFVHRPLLEVWPDACDARTGAAWCCADRQQTPRPVPAGLLYW